MLFRPSLVLGALVAGFLLANSAYAGAQCLPPPTCSDPTMPMLKWNDTDKKFECVALPLPPAPPTPPTCGTGQALSWNGTAFTCVSSCGNIGGFKGSVCPFKDQQIQCTIAGRATFYGRVRSDGIAEGRAYYLDGYWRDTGWEVVSLDGGLASLGALNSLEGARITVNGNGVSGVHFMPGDTTYCNAPWPGTGNN